MELTEIIITAHTPKSMLRQKEWRPIEIVNILPVGRVLLISAVMACSLFPFHVSSKYAGFRETGSKSLTI